MVDTSAAIGPNTRVAYAALADIEYARDLLDKLVMPQPARVPTGHLLITAVDIRDSVEDLIARINAPSRHLMVLPDVGVTITHPKVDLSAPVHPAHGKMSWAGVDCPKCSSKAGQRCQKSDGGFVEKPHKERKEIPDANVGEDQGERDLERLEVSS